jgi:hypothetical protein
VAWSKANSGLTILVAFCCSDPSAAENQICYCRVVNQPHFPHFWAPKDPILIGLCLWHIHCGTGQGP